MISNILSGLLTRFAAGGLCAEQTFLGLVPWYHYIPMNDKCEPTDFRFLGDSTHSSSILLVLLAIVDDLLRIVGFLAVIFVVYAGIKYIMSQGKPDEMSKAQSGLINAIVGLVISLLAIRGVAYIASTFGSGSGPAEGTSSVFLDLSTLPSSGAAESGAIITTVLNIMFGIAGALAFLFLVWGGFTFITSRGDPQETKKAMNTVLYSLVGLALAVVAQTLVPFVMSWL